MWEMMSHMKTSRKFTLMPGKAGRRDAQRSVYLVKRFGILNTIEETVEEKETVSSETQEVAEEEGTVEACFIDPLTGQKECS